MSRTRTLLAAIVLSALALGGCSDDPEPRSDPGPAPPSTSAVSPSAAGETARIEPEAVVRRWIKARNVALANGDLAPVRALTSPSCTSCAGILDPIEEVYKKGGHFETKGWSVARSKLRSQTSEAATVLTGLEFSGGRTFPESGAEPVDYDAEKHIVKFELTKAEYSWKVSLIGFIS